MRAARSVRFAPTASRVSYSRAILAQQKITQTKQYNRATTYKPYVKQPARIQSYHTYKNTVPRYTQKYQINKFRERPYKTESTFKYQPRHNRRTDFTQNRPQTYFERTPSSLYSRPKVARQPTAISTVINAVRSGQETSLQPLASAASGLKRNIRAKASFLTSLGSTARPQLSMVAAAAATTASRRRRAHKEAIYKMLEMEEQQAKQTSAELQLNQRFRGLKLDETSFINELEGLDFTPAKSMYTSASYGVAVPGF